MRRYKSFEEIDRDLKFLKLKSQIDQEELKLAATETKESVTPSKLAMGILGSVASGAVAVRLLMPLLTFGLSKFLSKYK